MAILLTAREWRQGFEWDVHAPLAAKACARRVHRAPSYTRGERRHV
jgi:hypothetical protein